MHSLRSNDAGNGGTHEAGPTVQDWHQQIAALRAQGAAQSDAVQLHFLEVLAARERTQEQPVRQLLQARLATGVQELQLRLAQVQGTSAANSVRVTGACKPSPLRALVHDLSHADSLLKSADQAGPAPTTVPARPELKAVRDFRKTWSLMSTDKQLKQAMSQAPQNAGPINSHMLVLRSLALMHAISPGYMNRFMAYADALLCLQESDKPAPRLPKPRRRQSAPT